MKRHRFWHDIGTVVLGTAVAQALPVAVLPVLTRVLSPDTFGAFYVWLGAVTVLVVAASLGLEIAVFSATTTAELRRLVGAASVASLAISTSVAICGVVAVAYVALPEQRSGMTALVAAGCLVASLTAINQVLFAVHIYHGRFTRQVVGRILLGMATAGLQLAFALGGLELTGLVLAQVVATAGVCGWLLWDTQMLRGTGVFGPRLIVATLRAHWRYPAFTMPANGISALTAQLPLILLGGQGSSEAAGFYALTQRVLAAPAGVVGGGVLTVFKERASRDYRLHGNCRAEWQRGFGALLGLGLLPFGAVHLFGEALFTVGFGNEWRTAGLLSEVLAPALLIKFVASPLGYTIYLAQRQAQDLMWQVALFACTLGAFILGKELIQAVTYMAITYGGLYAVYLAISHRAARGVDP